MLTPVSDPVTAAAPPKRSHDSGAWWTPGVLLAATLLTYHKIAFGPGVPGGYDTQTYFYAYRRAVAEALRAGTFPLWDPHIFLGVPLFANVQAAVLYPPNAIFLFWPAPEAIAASLILHVWWACWGMAVLCRRTFAVPWVAAIAGGAMFGLGGFLSAQAGHVNQVNTAAWLPWVLLCLDLAWQQRRAGYAVLAALLIAVQFLAGHTQESYFILCVVLAWGLWRLLQQLRSWRSLLAIIGTGIVALAGGIAVAGVQLLPTLELTGQSIRRGGLTMGEASSFSLRPDRLLIEMLPGLATQPDTTEHVAYVGVLGLLLAFLGLGTGYRRSGVWLLFLLVVVPFALAFGIYDPLWRFAFHAIPGFSSFRVPARWLYVTTFGLAALGALGVGAVWDRLPTYPSRPLRAAALIVVLATFGAAAVIALGRAVAPAPTEPLLVAIAFVALLLLAITTAGLRPGRGSAAIAVIVKLVLPVAAIFELVVAASWLDLNAPVPLQVYSDQRQTVDYLQGHRNEGRALSLANDAYAPGDNGSLQQIATATTGTDSAYRTAVATKLQDVLTPNLSLAYDVDSLDGYDGGILPLANYVALKQLILPSCAICANPDAVLRAELSAPPPPRWLQFFGVGNVIDDRIHDFHYAGATYDLNNTIVVPPGASSATGRFIAAPATVVGVVTDVTGATPNPGTAVARLSLLDTAGRITEATLTAGVNTAALLGNATVQPNIGLRDQPNGHAYLAQIELPDRPWLQSISITSLLSSGNVELRALTLHDGLTQSDTTVPLSADGTISRVLSGDVNIYHVAGGAPVFLALGMQTSGDDGQIAALLRRPDFPLLQRAILSYPDPGPRLSLATRALRRLDGILQGDPRLLPPPPPASATRGSFTEVNQDGHLQANVTTDGDAYLVVKQSWYPGWRATVDGHQVPIYRADLALQAVAVPAGTHTIVVTYHPASVLVGTAVSVAGVIGLLLVLVVALRWRGKARQSP